MWLPSHGQPKSAIQFYDTTTTQPTAKIGWTGMANNGSFFVEMPNNKKVTITGGDMTVTGQVTATQFSGSGTGLTNVTPASHAHPESDITGLTGDLGKKADTATVMPLIRSKADAGSVGITAQAVSDSLKRKADTTKVNQLFAGGQNNQVWKKTAAGGYGWGNDSVGTTVTAGVTQITAGSGIALSPSGGTGVVAIAVPNGGIDSNRIASNTISKTRIAPNSIDSTCLANNSVGTSEIADSSVTGGKIASNAISDANIYSISGSKIHPDFGYNDIKTKSYVYLGDSVRIGPLNGVQMFSIGELDPTYGWCGLVDVDISATARCNARYRGDVYVEDHMHCPSYLNDSDRRLKKEISPFDSALAKIKQLQGVYFLWDRDKYPEKNLPEGRQIGFVAQDVERVVPELVHTDADGYKSITYDKVAAMLVEAIKEQQKMIDTLRIENAVLKREMAEIIPAR
jgi:hypothetical protein